MTQAVMDRPAAKKDPGQHRDQLLRTFPGRLILWAHDRTHQVAMRDKRFGRWREIPWREYLEHVEAVALALDELGVGYGDHVAIHSDNRPEWMYVDLAVQGLGGRSVGIYQTNPPSDVAYLLNHSGSVVLFAEDQEQVDKAVEVADETPSVKRIVVFEPRGTSEIDDNRLMPWDEFLARGFELLAEKPGWFFDKVLALDPDDPAMIVYTSGTTGAPKGAMLSHRNGLSAEELTKSLGYGESDLILSYLPLCHVAEKIFSLFSAMISGCVVHFGESIDTVRADLREVSPTIFLGVPRIWEKMYTSIQVRMQDASWLKKKVFDTCVGVGRRIAPKRELGTMTVFDRLAWLVCDVLVFRALQEKLGMRRIKFAGSGAAPISPEILLWFNSIGVPVLEGYGQTECGGISHLNYPGNSRLGSVGQPATGVECRISDEGEVLLRGDGVFRGYLHNPEATAKTIDEDGWLHTGDVGSIDDDGFLWSTGRMKGGNITSGGKNLSPEKIENALKTSPYINEAVAIGDARKFVSALVLIEYDVVADWAMRESIQYTSFEDLASQPAVLKLLDKEIGRCNELLARVEHVRAFRTLPKELNEDDGELTATRKVRRRNVHAAYEYLITEIYG